MTEVLCSHLSCRFNENGTCRRSRIYIRFRPSDPTAPCCDDFKVKVIGKVRWRK